MRVPGHPLSGRYVQDPGLLTEAGPPCAVNSCCLTTPFPAASPHTVHPAPFSATASLPVFPLVPPSPFPSPGSGLTRSADVEARREPKVCVRERFVWCVRGGIKCSGAIRGWAQKTERR